METAGDTGLLVQEPAALAAGTSEFAEDEQLRDEEENLQSHSDLSDLVKVEESMTVDGESCGDGTPIQPTQEEPGQSDLSDAVRAEELIPVDGDSCGDRTPNRQTQEEPVWDEGAVDSLGVASEEPEANRRHSLKRSRPPAFDNTPSVQIIYKCLTSESKRKLKELLWQWAEWHSTSVTSAEEENKESLESGDEMYFPALCVKGESKDSKSSLPFWMDKPSKQARTENAVLDLTPSQDREKEVPLYDRAGMGVLVSQETEMSMEGILEPPEDASRCFNCGSYSHSLKECPRPRDNAAINNARKLLAEKRGSANGSRTASRYYQSSPGGKFDDLKPGLLGTETRQCLGIGDFDPPPWLNRMRELGYPPGYLENQEDEPSGITIFGGSESIIEACYLGEDGEIMENGMVVKKKSSTQKMTVSFPGVNAPIPDDVDKRIWASPADSSAGRGHPGHRGRKGRFSPSYSAAAVTSDGTVYTGTRDRGTGSEVLPGPSKDTLLRNSKMRSPIADGGITKGSPLYQSESGRSGRGTPTGSPYLGRSLSDSGRRSPNVGYDDPRSLPPLAGTPVGLRQSNLMPSPRSHHSSHMGAPVNISPSQRSPYGQEYREDMSEARRRAWANAQDALAASHYSERYLPSRRR